MARYGPEGYRVVWYALPGAVAVLALTLPFTPVIDWVSQLLDPDPAATDKAWLFESRFLAGGYVALVSSIVALPAGYLATAYRRPVWLVVPVVGIDYGVFFLAAVTTLFSDLTAFAVYAAVTLFVLFLLAGFGVLPRRAPSRPGRRSPRS